MKIYSDKFISQFSNFNSNLNKFLNLLIFESIQKKFGKIVPRPTGWIPSGLLAQSAAAHLHRTVQPGSHRNAWPMTTLGRHCMRPKTTRPGTGVLARARAARMRWCNCAGGSAALDPSRVVLRQWPSVWWRSSKRSAERMRRPHRRLAGGRWQRQRGLTVDDFEFH
jgi:hypothetical protein